MIRTVLALLLLGHAVAHVPGFLVFWRIASLEGLPYKTTILAGAVDIGEAGIRVFGTLWLLAALGFVVCAAAVFLQTAWWLPATLIAAVVSLLLCILGLPDSRIGLFLNVLLLLALVMAHQTGRMP
jgi:hypothetical protein